MRITVDLLRRRAEHNDGCLSDLKEIALHQQEIEKLEVVGDVCRQLEILYLCNNYICKIEGLHHLKNLQYINLAVNNIAEISGLEGCEMLQRLDLTLNFVGDMNCVANLCANAFLQTLHLTGNPCTKTPGYRAFVVHTLPHLTDLDGEPVLRSERIIARQDEPEIVQSVEQDALKVREQERIKAELVKKGIDPFPPKFNEGGERVYGHSPEERIQMLRETQEEEQKRKNPPVDPNSISALHAELNKKPVRLSADEEIAKHGRLLMRNEAKFPFTFDESGNEVVITLDPGKYVSTTLINLEIETTYVRITVKDKLAQFPLSVEVSPSLAKVQRASTTGQLKVTIPLAPRSGRTNARQLQRLTDSSHVVFLHQKFFLKYRMTLVFTCVIFGRGTA
jgi:protein TilB